MLEGDCRSALLANSVADDILRAVLFSCRFGRVKEWQDWVINSTRRAAVTKRGSGDLIARGGQEQESGKCKEYEIVINNIMHK